MLAFNSVFQDAQGNGKALATIKVYVSGPEPRTLASIYRLDGSPVDQATNPIKTNVRGQYAFRCDDATIDIEGLAISGETFQLLGVEHYEVIPKLQTIDEARATAIAAAAASGALVKWRKAALTALELQALAIGRVVRIVKDESQNDYMTEYTVIDAGGGVRALGESKIVDVDVALTRLDRGAYAPWSAGLAAAGKYRVMDVVLRGDGSGYWQNTVTGNATDPDAGGAGWVDFLYPREFDNTTDLRAYPPPRTSAGRTQSVLVLSVGTGGDLRYYYDPTSTDAHNGVAVVQPISVAGPGRWKVGISQKMSPRHWGARDDWRRGTGSIGVLGTRVTINPALPGVVEQTLKGFTPDDVGKTILVHRHTGKFVDVGVVPSVLGVITAYVSPTQVDISVAATQALNNEEVYVTTLNNVAVQSASDWCALNRRKLFFEGTKFGVSAQINLRSYSRWKGDGEDGGLLLLQNYSPNFAGAGCLLLRETASIEHPFTSFSREVSIEGVSFQGAITVTRVACIVNVRGFRFVGCKTIRAGGVIVTHEAEYSGAYSASATGGNSTTDTAVLAGFSPIHTDDLNEDVQIKNCTFDRDCDYSRANAIRLHFTKRFQVIGVKCIACNISGWGGGAPMTGGGYTNALRRVRDGVITGCEIRCSNGGVYFNNCDGLQVTSCVAETITDTGFDTEGCINTTITSCTARDCGNFCFSHFFQGRGNKFTANTGIQSARASTLRALFGETNYGPGEGRTCFRQLSAFNDTREPYKNELEVSGCTFVWEGDAGFGRVVFDTYVPINFHHNTLKNVCVDHRSQANNENIKYENNKHFYTNPPVSTTPCYVALGTRQFNGQSSVVKDNDFYVRNSPPGAVVLLLVTSIGNGHRHTVFARGTTIDVNAGVLTPLAYCDARTSSGANTRACFDIQGTRLSSGAIKNISLIPPAATNAYPPTLAEADNKNFALTNLAVDTASDTSIYGTLAFLPS